MDETSTAEGRTLLARMVKKTSVRVGREELGNNGVWEFPCRHAFLTEYRAFGP